MPKPMQKRGRRMKRKHDDEHDDSLPDSFSKRQKSNHQAEEAMEDSADQDPVSLHSHSEDMSAACPGGAEKAFFGVLDDQEQEFFKNADNLLEQNDFPNSEERAAFLQSVFREADDKALKLAQSQSCSRVLERLIKLSNASQLKALFQKFSGNFIHLLSHRFASHCCESLFTYAAPHVSEELKAKPSELRSQNPDDVFVSMENLFLHTLAELEGNFGYLLTEKYASHALRILLLVLAGEPISTDSMKTLLRSKRKEGAPGKGGNEATGKTRPVPKSFAVALEKLISDSVAGLDTDKLRGLTTHPNANPTLQVLLTLELTHYGKQRGKDEKSIIRTLLPDELFTEDCDSAKFLSGLVFDPVGSHLVEKIIQHAPSKLFKSMYKTFFKERLATHARNEVATHVVCRLLERLGYDDLLEAHEILLPEIPGLLQKHWTAMPQTMIERCAVRDIDTQAIAVQIDQFYSSETGFHIMKMLHVDDKSNETASATGQGTGSNTAATFFPRPSETNKVQFNILAQAMLIVPGSLSALILDALTALDKDMILHMSKDYIVTRTLQQALTTKNASMVQRRKLIARFQSNIGEMALDKSASHVVDCIWEGTHGLAFIRERIAEELAENEAALRESPCGRAVWKNWKMDIYKRKRHEWVRQSRIKASNDGFQAFSEIEARKEGVRKTPLQIARERHAQKKMKTEKEEKEPKKEKTSEDGSTKLLTAVQTLVVNFIRSADQDTSTDQTTKNNSLTLLTPHPPSHLQTLLNPTLPTQGLGRPGLLSAAQTLLTHSVNTWHQNFLDKLYSTNTPVGLASDLLLSALNTNAHVYAVSPALTLIEKSVARGLASLFGLTGPFAGGVSQPGGSAANASSLVIARNVLFPETKVQGNGGRKFVVFTSRHGHYSVEKAAQMCGLGSDAVRFVDVDDQGRMLPDALEKGILAAKEVGEVPFYVVATAGTTVLGSFDPVKEIVRVARRWGLWVHVDGSWGGSVVFSERQRRSGKLDGMEGADSITICAHKMLNVPVTCSFLLGRDLRLFRKGMTLPAGYLFHGDDDDDDDDDDDEVEGNGHLQDDEAKEEKEEQQQQQQQQQRGDQFFDLADLTPQCGRRADSLKLFLAWTYQGTTGFATSIDHAFATAAHLTNLLASNENFSLVSSNPPPCLQVCFYFHKHQQTEEDQQQQQQQQQQEAMMMIKKKKKPKKQKKNNNNSATTEQICKTLLRRGEFMVDYAPGEEGEFFRVVVNCYTKRETMEKLVRRIEEVGEELGF
ncbi:hypothetical protein CERZMDRAFT_110750 [Cercospora zeae-maydis SCOH1-5]|uniref:PLP-dependent transferase n=1 Tax=Cercospora zeae-maydis SCOH1-5 TaxID=717836 RepID=A0A6A6FLV0_9PEZI|nr:hypothetical protein CERZMDRAFT_110750 [Cercospora zeae-maydis SCOH1-5]